MNNETTRTNNDKERKAFFKFLDNVAARVVADNGYTVKGSTLDALVKRFTVLDNVAADIAAIFDESTYKTTDHVTGETLTLVKSVRALSRLVYRRADELKAGRTDWAGWFNDTPADAVGDEREETADTPAAVEETADDTPTDAADAVDIARRVVGALEIMAQYEAADAVRIRMYGERCGNGWRVYVPADTLPDCTPIAPALSAFFRRPVSFSSPSILRDRVKALDDIAAADDWRTMSPRALSSIVGLSVRCAVAASTDATPADLAAAVELSGRLSVEVDESPRRLYGAPVYFRLTVPFDAYRLARFFNQISRAISAHFGADIVAVFVVKG